MAREREIGQESLKGINGGVREVKGESGRWEKHSYIVTLEIQPLLRFQPRSGTTGPCPGTTGTHGVAAEPYQAVQPGDQAVAPVEKNNRSNRPATAQPPHRNRRESPLSAVVERYRAGATAWP